MQVRELKSGKLAAVDSTRTVVFIGTADQVDTFLGYDEDSYFAETCDARTPSVHRHRAPQR